MRIVVSLVWVVCLSGCAVFNQPIINDLRDSPSEQRGERLLLLTSEYGQLPLRFLQQRKCVYLGAGGGWWKDFSSPTPVEVWLRGKRTTGVAQTFESAESTRQIVMKQLRDRWPSNWIGLVKPGRLVVVDLDPDEQAGDPARCLREFEAE